ncbi:hypothetical protein FQN54_004121 [Arachnomyces sp. PD_36]|nr:hypothetical protein FQN54_004121 [Arachnomyces sp. PD_36]
MAPSQPTTTTTSPSHLSPSELAYLHTSLSLPPSSHGPIRPDGRSPTQFRPLTAETDILPGANGSARVGFADGSEVVVGVKAEICKVDVRQEDVRGVGVGGDGDEEGGDEGEGEGDGGGGKATGSGWVQMSIEIPGYRDDDALPVFLAEMMREAVLAGGEGLMRRLRVNRRWGWRVYVDILLLSPPLSYPLPLLSLATHLALLSTRLPRLKSEGEEDPLFDDDWDVAEYLYPRSSSHSKNINNKQWFRPPITLLVISVGENIIFDPSREEIAVAEAVLAVSVGRSEDEDGSAASGDNPLKLLSIRTVDPPSRMTHPGIPDSENAATTSVGLDSGAGAGGVVGAGGAGREDTGAALGGGDEVPGVWRPRRGGVKRSVISRMVKLVLEKGGVGDEVLEGLEGVRVG